MLGNTVEILGIAFALYLILIAPDFPGVLLRFLIYVVAWGCLVFFPHCLTHFIVGRVVGVRFRYYFLGNSAVTKLKLRFLSTIASRLPVLTLKVDQVSLRSVSRGGRVAMFASGAAASMILPFLAAVASLHRVPLMLSLILLLLSAGNITFDLYYSPKAGDISRARFTAK
jgi:hypothetical protein